MANVTMGGQRTGPADMGLLQEPPEFGFTWTQDQIFVPRAKGYSIANIHIYGLGALWPFPDGQLP